MRRSSTVPIEMTTTLPIKFAFTADTTAWQWISFGPQLSACTFVTASLLWLLCVTRGGTYFTKRSISDCHMHMILFAILSAFLGFCSLIAYLIFGSHYFHFGIYFAACAVHCLLMDLLLFVVKYRFQIACAAMVKQNCELGTPITEREAADLCRIKQYYEKTRKSTNWQKPVFTREQLEAWARYLAIADLTGEKQQALTQIVAEMRRGPLNWGPTYFQASGNPIPAISNLVPPEYYP